MRTAAWFVLCALALVAPAAAQDSEAPRRILANDHLRILHWPEHAELAEIARDSGNDAIVRLQSILDMELEDRVDIYIVRSQDEFDRLTGVENKPWTIGRALPSILRIVVKPMGPQRLPELIAHELAHILLDLRMGDQAHHLPRWLHEGIAKYATDDFDENDRRLIAEAALAERLLTIDELAEAFRGDRDEVALAYAQSYTLVAYLSDIRPARGVAPLLDQIAKGQDMRLALGLAFHRPVPKMEREWLEQIRTGYVHEVAPPLSDALIGALFVVAFFIAWLLVRRRSSRIRKRMMREEQMRQTAGGLPRGPYTILSPPGADNDVADDDAEPFIE
ncbi:MAG: peptidase MA family metallohydrolase [Armatimonadota bacterium]